MPYIEDGTKQDKISHPAWLDRRSVAAVFLEEVSATYSSEEKSSTRIRLNKTEQDITVEFPTPLSCGNSNDSIRALLMNGTIQLLGE
jgi:hypothetical protein